MLRIHDTNETMLQTVTLLLPALIPSWRFFDRIAPSPRIEFALLETEQETPGNWQEFRPRPVRLGALDFLRRMVFNPRWNESLFLVSCAERLMQHPTEHSSQEIHKRIEADLKRDKIAAAYLQFRLVFVSRDGTQLQKHITYLSPVYPYAKRADS